MIALHFLRSVTNPLGTFKPGFVLYKRDCGEYCSNGKLQLHRA